MDPRCCHYSGEVGAEAAQSATGSDPERPDEGSAQQLCTALSASTQAFVTLSTQQLESLTRLICCVGVSTAADSGSYGGGLMNVGTAGKRATGANEGIVSNVESNVVMRTDEV